MFVHFTIIIIIIIMVIDRFIHLFPVLTFHKYAQTMNTIRYVRKHSKNYKCGVINIIILF